MIYSRMYFDISYIQVKYGKYQILFCGILSISQNIVMNMNNLMHGNLFWCIEGQTPLKSKLLIYLFGQSKVILIKSNVHMTIL